MSYFEPDATLEARVGKVIGDALSALITLSVLVLVATSVLR
jgi:hypothetical protein